MIRSVARDGFRLLLDQLSTLEVAGMRFAAYREAVQGQGRVFDPMHVGLTRGLHMAMNPAQHALRARFLAHVRALTVNPAAGGGTLALPASPEDIHASTEETTLIGTPEEIIARLNAIKAQGIEYVLLMDLGGSIPALRSFAREVMPAFRDAHP